MAKETPEEVPTCVWETKNEEGEWGEGTCDEGFPVGEGRMTFPNGDIFEGTYVKSMIPDPVAVAEAEAVAEEKAAADEAAAAAGDGDAAEGEAEPAEGEPAPPAEEETPEPEIPLIPISMRQGKGKYVFKPLDETEGNELSGGLYDGDFVDNKKHGTGTKTFPDGSKYVGSFVDDAIHGEGEYTYVSGDIYRGQFEKGKKQGNGSYFFAKSASTFMGNWTAGAFESGEWVYADGTSYSGTFQDGKPHGKGTYTYVQNGNTQSGEWQKDGAFVGGTIKAGV